MNLTLSRELLPLTALWEAAYDEARDLDKFKPDWDGEGADAVSLELIEATIRLLRGLECQGFPAPVSVYPLTDGTVMAEFHYVHGAVDSVNIRTRGRIEIVRREPGAKPTFSTFSLGDILGNDVDATLGSSIPYVSDGFVFSLAA